MTTKLDIYLELLNAIESNELTNNPTTEEVEKLASQIIYSEIEMDTLLEEMHQMVVKAVDEEMKNKVSEN